MTKRASAFTAIVISQIIFAVIGGLGSNLGLMMFAGIELVAPTAVLLLFAILYFGIMMDSGLFDPVSRTILKVAKGDPVKIVVGTAILALLVALDGDGTTSYMIICSAMLPIYHKIGINPLVLAAIAVMALGTISGMTSWGGAATRGISVLGLDASKYFMPLIPMMVCGSLFIIVLAYVMGRMERKRIGKAKIQEASVEIAAAVTKKEVTVSWKIWFNFILTLALLVSLVMELPLCQYYYHRVRHRTAS
ncbi:citrate:proton symporter [Terribacillus saccharophilus]|uniref:citrate:proton symporter n=1 Tax=Terribacillus saccharophilus TaxID=361277 RepID=UPI0039822FAD